MTDPFRHDWMIREARWWFGRCRYEIISTSIYEHDIYAVTTDSHIAHRIVEAMNEVRRGKQPRKS